jgi:hypothetical protein
MAKPNKFITPPWINLKDGLELISIIYERGAGSISSDELARLMKSTVKSSAFGMKLVALRKYGLIQTEGHAIKITQLGNAIMAPSSNEERQAAIFQSFNSIQLHAQLHQRYRGGFLPEDSFLANTLEREFNVSPDDKDKWVECFKESGKVAGVLNYEGGKIRVLQAPTASSGPNPPFSPLRQGDPLPPPPPPPIDHKSHFEVVLDENRRVSVPLELNREDLEYLQGVLDLYVKRRETKK